MYVLPFSDPRAQDVGVAGGKGANLARLTGFGLRVPGGVIVTRASYDLFIGQAGWLAERVRQLDFAAPETLRAQAEAIRSALRELPLPAEVAAAIRAAVAALDGAESVSVRSSATAEDTAAAAFAGQHDTFLNVPPGRVEEFVKQCWLSLWSDRALAYRRQVGVGILDTSMAVVVQRMVQAEVAGVLFTVDPVSGELDKAVVDANYGLGESVVSGEAEIDHWQLDKASGAVVAARIAEKTMQIRSLPGGGTEEVEIHGAECGAPSLDAARLSEMAALARTIEAHYGFPQDIEWAIAQDAIHVLQSRPITSISPRWTRDESAERFPNPVSPLAWELVEDGFHRSLNHSFRLMGLPPFEGKWFAMFDGYIYGNQTAVSLYADGVPLALRSLDELRALLPLIRQKYGWVQELPVNWSRDLDGYLLRLGEFNAMPLAGLGLKALWAHVLDISETGARYFLPNIAISITQRVLYKVLHGILALVLGPPQAAAAFDALLAHCDTKTGAINAQLNELAGMVREHAEFFAAHGTQEILDQWRTTVAPALPGFVAAFDRLLAEHGHREIEFDPYVPTWLEAPGVVLDTLRVMARGELLNPRANERQLKVRMQETLFAVQQRVSDDLRYFVTEVVRLAQIYTSLDDLEHYQTTRLTLPLRRALRELGARLVELGLIDAPMDVFFARVPLLGQAILEPGPARWAELAEQIAANKRVYENARQRSPAWMPGGDAAADEAGAPGADAAWTGIPGSPGKAVAPVFLLRGAEDFGSFPKGAVLVARTTNPAWTPLFYGASAVITESGGPLSHGAVTAREMQKPAVMAVRGIMQCLANGERVEVDGTRGTVRRVAGT
ncbi:PEP/pyruvate-binding domain-containing protein [Propionivibrio sp.]|uniref:PEP/pyruvate-binding domain-containing protein n=1 Tax=Propionivibrio sp. TaxID=2212460 RepID=UPI0039E4A155